MNTAIATPTPTLCGKAQKPSGKRIALFYDTSAQRKESKQWHDVKKIMTKELLEKNTLNIYFFNTNISARKNSTDTPIYFGEQGDLSKINIKKGEYDEVIIITDKKFNLTENTINRLSVVPKIYIIYETDAIPAFTLPVARALIQNKVTVSDSLQDVMTISAYTNNMGDDKLITPFWIIEETKEKNISPNELEPIITRININNKIHNTKGELENNREIMQPLHEQARAAKIVTIFSSYIALVNETQQQTLQKESQTEYAYTEINARHSQSETRTVTPIRPTGPIYNFAIGEYGIHDIVKLAIIITVLITAGGVILVGAKYIKQNIQK